MLAAFYGRLDLAGAHVVDVGAHNGRHAVPLAKQVGPRGMVHAFEPIPQIRQQLVLRLVAEGINNTVVLPFALADAPAVTEFVYKPACPEESGLRRRVVYNLGITPEELIPVQVCRLDDILPRAPVRFIKMDVEGGERDVLRGAVRILDESQPIVAFECGASGFRAYHDQPDEIFLAFSTRGYSVYTILGRRLETVEQFREAAFTQQTWDYIALPARDAQLHTLLTA